ncbi:MAG TPA: hypothetical protein PKY31_07540 [Spirochaetota bacterium]|nr:hypothetical protein [Spirochaetota bacterium]
MKNKTLVAVLTLLLITGLQAQTKNQAQDAKQPRAGGEPAEVVGHPVQSYRTHIFDVEKFSISFGYEPRGYGEILTVEFGIHNKTGDDRDLYIYTIATEDVDTTGYTSFKRPQDDIRILFKNFVPFPLAAEDKDKEFRHMSLANFRYKMGNDVDPKGTLRKFPRDPKLGVDPTTGKAYKLDESLYVKTQHHSKYRKNYCFFNHVTVLIFDAKELTDDKGNINPPLFRQVYRISGKRK